MRFSLSKNRCLSIEKSFGKESMGIVRTTFIIDEDGVIIDVIERLK